MGELRHSERSFIVTAGESNERHIRQVANRLASELMELAPRWERFVVIRSKVSAPDVRESPCTLISCKLEWRNE